MEASISWLLLLAVAFVGTQSAARNTNILSIATILILQICRVPICMSRSITFHLPWSESATWNTTLRMWLLWLWLFVCKMSTHCARKRVFFHRLATFTTLWRAQLEDLSIEKLFVILLCPIVRNTHLELCEAACLLNGATY